MSRNNYGTFLLSDFTRSLSVDDVVRALRLQFKQSLLENPIYVGDLEVKLGQTPTGNGGHRYWFVCPACGTCVAKLYFYDPLAACRHCMSVKYRSSRYKGMLENSFDQMQGSK